MNLLRFDNLRFIDRNKLGGDAVFDCNGIEKKADFHFYLQGDRCLSIHLGRHDPDLSTAELQEFLDQNQVSLRRKMQPDFKRLREERHRMIYGDD